MSRLFLPISSRQRRSLQRLGWMLLIWACSCGVLAVVALGMRLVMRLAGMA